MRTKVRLHLDGDLVPHYPDWSLELFVRTNGSIAAKIEQALIDLPCRPVCGDCLNLLSFAGDFGFTDFEVECLADCNYEVEVYKCLIHHEPLVVLIRKVE